MPQWVAVSGSMGSLSAGCPLPPVGATDEAAAAAETVVLAKLEMKSDFIARIWSQFARGWFGRAAGPFRVTE